MTMHDEIYTKVITIVADVLSIDKNTITAQSTFDQLGVDSLDKLEIVMKLEEAFGVEVNDEEAAKIESIQEAVDKIKTLKSNR